ncbi:precorrin-3B synthase [Rhodoferax sp.]|uniref:precorrin-3B synthase n=1 Tax=Rhodoferax sp. TaxID=50421 RepID=UPI002ACE6431|nr:precorrin-3B synthase [Rhodoferax sp.]
MRVTDAFPPVQSHLSPSTASEPRIQGWCPGALRPMPSGDGLVVRVRPTLGRLTPMQAQGLAGLAQQYASPVLELTSRANLQLRGVCPDSYPALINGLRNLGLLDERADVEARRNLLLSPFWTDSDGTPAVCEALTQALAAPDAPTLPSKFGLAIDLGTQPVLRAGSADIRLERQRDQVLVYADGASTGACVSPDRAAQTALELARWFVANGGVVNGRGRMARLLQRQALPTPFTTTSVPEAPAHAATVGRSATGMVVGLEFGQLPADTLHRLAALAPLRITPWRGLVLEGVHTAPALPELITQPGDARLRVMACTGAPGCTQALGPTRALARFLAPLLPAGRTAHVSGCTKGCAHHGATLTLVASDAGYHLIDHGTAHSPPDATGLDAAGIAAYLEQQRLHAPHV